MNPYLKCKLCGYIVKDTQEAVWHLRERHGIEPTLKEKFNPSRRY